MILELDAHGLKKFGLTFALIIAGAFGVLVPWIFDLEFRWWPWIVAVIFVIWSLTAANTIRPFYRLWMRFGLVLNAITSRIILGIVFYLMILPMGMIMRFRKNDPMARTWNHNSVSYRTPSQKPKENQMEKPY
ncbi:SxtJ family membrane protein [Pseudomonadota bacterium]